MRDNPALPIRIACARGGRIPNYPGADGPGKAIPDRRQTQSA